MLTCEEQQRKDEAAHILIEATREGLVWGSRKDDGDLLVDGGSVLCRLEPSGKRGTHIHLSFSIWDWYEEFEVSQSLLRELWSLAEMSKKPTNAPFSRRPYEVIVRELKLGIQDKSPMSSCSPHIDEVEMEW
jgi:hypothetical protein